VTGVQTCALPISVLNAPDDSTYSTGDAPAGTGTKQKWTPAEIDRTANEARLHIVPLGKLVPEINGASAAYRNAKKLSENYTAQRTEAQNVSGDLAAAVARKVAQEPLFALWYKVHELLREKGGKAMKSQARFGRMVFDSDAIRVMATIQEYDVDIEAAVAGYMEQVEWLKERKNVNTKFGWKRFHTFLEGFVSDLENGKVENGDDSDEPPELRERLKGLQGFARERVRQLYEKEQREGSGS